MDSTIWQALIISIAPTLASLGTLYIGLRNGTKADAIHVLVNSNLTKVKTDLALALERVVNLEALLTKTHKKNVKEI